MYINCAKKTPVSFCSAGKELKPNSRRWSFQDSKKSVKGVIWGFVCLFFLLRCGFGARFDVFYVAIVFLVCLNRHQ